MVSLAFLCALLPCVLSARLPIQWTPGGKPDKILLTKTNSSAVYLILNNGVTFQNNLQYFRRQLFQSTQVVDVAQINILARNIQTQNERFQKLSKLNVHDKYLSRADLDFEYIFKDYLKFDQCVNYCIFNQGHLLENVSELKSVQKFVPRYSDFYWINTRQSATLKQYKANYTIYFDNVNLWENSSILGYNNSQIQGIDKNGQLSDIPQDKLAPRYSYWNAIDNDYYFPEHLKLLTKVNNDGRIRFLLPVLNSALHVPEYFAQCICARNLNQNLNTLQKSQSIARQAANLLSGISTDIEEIRFKSVDENNLVPIDQVLTSNLYHNPKIVKPAEIGVLSHSNNQSDTLHQLGTVNDISEAAQFFSNFSELKLDLKNPNLIYDNDEEYEASTNKLTQIGNTKLSRSKRLAPIVIQSLPAASKYLFKIAASSSPYLLQKFNPYSQLRNKLKKYFQLKPPQITNKVTDTLKKFFIKSPVKVNISENIYSIRFKNPFNSINTLEQPSLYFARQIYRAAHQLQYFHKHLINILPQIIFANLKKNIKFPIKRIQVGATRKGSLLFFHYIWEVERNDEPVEDLSFVSLPHMTKGQQDFQYQLPANFTQNDFHIKSKQETCLQSILQQKVTNFPSTCPMVPALEQSIIRPLFKDNKPPILIIRGPSQLQLACRGEPSVFQMLKYDVNVILLGKDCQITVNYKNLKGSFVLPSSVTNSNRFELLLQYDLPLTSSFQDHFSLVVTILSILGTVLVTMILLLLIFICYLKFQYKAVVLEDIPEDWKESGNVERAKDLDVLEPKQGLPLAQGSDQKVGFPRPWPCCPKRNSEK